MSAPIQYHYGNFPPEDLDWTELIPLIGPANAALARYDGTLAVIQNASVLLSPLLREARGRRSGVYAFSELLNIAEGQDVL